MNIGKIDNSQSFQALNIKNVCSADRTFIKKDFQKLQELGKKYNIRLTSVYSTTPEFGVIDVDVKPLNKYLSLWERIFPPIGRGTFHTNDISIIESVQHAIKDLVNKISK